MWTLGKRYPERRREHVEMRNLLRYSLLAVICGSLLAAQGHGGGGHSSGGGHASGPSGHASFGGYRGSGLVGYNAAFHTGIPPQPTRVNRIIGNRDFRGRVPYRYGYGYVLPYYPYFGYDDFSNDSSAYGPVDTSAEQTGEVTANLLGDEIQRLSAQVDSLQGAPQPYSQQVPYPPQQYPMQPYPMQSAPPADDPQASKPIVLVLRSGQTLQVQNYAIMSGVLWDFTRPNSKRISLSSIDAAASEKATDAAGGSFPEASFGVNLN
jgi:hypothetical protein